MVHIDWSNFIWPAFKIALFCFEHQLCQVYILHIFVRSSLAVHEVRSVTLNEKFVNGRAGRLSLCELFGFFDFYDF
jgi:hypothetical protein